MIPVVSALGSVVGNMASEILGGAQQASPGSTAGADFGDIFTQVGKTINDIKRAEATSISGIRGETSAQDVVETVLRAEQSLQTAVAIRDKFVSAYQTLSQMPI